MYIENIEYCRGNIDELYVLFHNFPGRQQAREIRDKRNMDEFVIGFFGVLEYIFVFAEGFTVIGRNYEKCVAIDSEFFQF